MAGFTKLCSSIVTSSIWSENHPTRIVWVTMLAMSDADGRVEASLPGLARLANVTLDECKAAIRKFTEPDEHSRTSDYEGRRITEIDGGWLILNYPKYREKIDPASRRKQNRESAQTRREKLREEAVASASVSKTDQELLTDADKAQLGVQNEPLSAHAEDRSQKSEEEKKETTITTPARETFVPPSPDVVRKNAPGLLKLWNSFAPKPVRSALEEMAIERAYSVLVLGLPPNRLCPEQVMGAVENYREALALPSSQAPPLALGRFLAWEIVSKYLPGNFTLENYDKTRFGRDGPKPCDSETGLEELKKLGVL